MNDLLLNDEANGQRLQLANDPHGVVLNWEWQGCGGSLWLPNDQAAKICAWLTAREPQQDQSDG